MNYIIWNGIDSRSLQGLLICELPPITKPAMRTQITEIEGKDGDITDVLGYQAYDKILKIGLYSNYDTNQIAKYFTGSGQITFSNEPDKFYNAQILEQIDFERLLRFKTATVKFHMQPFKYLVDEQPVKLEITNETEFLVTNQGLENSKPVIALTGSGIVEISKNNYAQFQIDFGENNSHITVDSEIEEAYESNSQNLKNRSMAGIFPVLEPGENTITWTGNLTKIEVQAKSRWL